MNKSKEESLKNQRNEDICTTRCKEFACSIQMCLQNNYNKQVKCEGFIKQWNECCDLAKKDIETKA